MKYQEMGVKGINSKDVNLFENFKIKANKEQLQAMIKELEAEYLKRN